MGLGLYKSEVEQLPNIYKASSPALKKKNYAFQHFIEFLIPYAFEGWITSINENFSHIFGVVYAQTLLGFQNDLVVPRLF